MARTSTEGQTAAQFASDRVRPLRDAAVIGVLLLSTAVLSALGLYHRATRTCTLEVRTGLAHQAQTLAVLIDGDQHRAFTSPEQEDSAEYRTAVAPLRRALQEVPGLRFVYTAISANDQVYLVLDASPPGDADGDGVEDHSGIMEPYGDADREMLVALREGRSTASLAPTADKWGLLMSGYAPIFDSAGQQVGIVGVDITAAEYAERLAAMRRAMLWGLLPAVAACLLATVGVWWLRRGAWKTARARCAAEETLRLEREQFLSIFDSIDEPVYVTHPTTHEFLYVNGAFRKLWGDVAGRRCYEAIQGLSGPCSFCPNDRMFGATAAPGQTWEFESAKVGRWFRRMGKAIRWPGGQLVYYSMATDVTEQRRMGTLLAESESRYRLLAECATDMISRVAADGTWLYVSPACRPLLGYEPAELLGRQPYEFVEPRDLERARQHHEQILAIPESHTFECRLRRRDGIYHWFESTAQARRDTASGEVIEIITVSRDIETRKRAEGELHIKALALAAANQELETQKLSLEAQRQQLEQVNQELAEAWRAAEIASTAKSQFLARMSHEIRTPMTAILGFADQLLDETLTAEERTESSHTIRRNGQYLLNIINDVLDLSKIEAGMFTTEILPTAPDVLVRDVCALMRPRAAAKGLSLEATFSDAVPAQVATDPTRLRQALINLVSNAVKFTEAGFVRVEASFNCTATAAGSLLQFDVVDSGIGISPAQQARLFQPFAQADASTNRRFGGSGLGLSISRHIAQKLGGDLQLVQSTAGEGARFRLTVAAQPASTAPPSDSAAPPAAAVSNSPGSGARPAAVFSGQVLLAEDGPDNQRLICYTLRRLGADVTTADNGQIALDLAQASRERGQPFDLILMDMQMPIMDGLEAVRRLRAAGYTEPIVALTANALAEDRNACLAAGCDDYASKPIDRAKLHAILARYLDAVTAANTAG